MATLKEKTSARQKVTNAIPSEVVRLAIDHLPSEYEQRLKLRVIE